jgi:hypothetical protein
MQLNISEEVEHRLRDKAASAGYQNVEAYILDLVDEDMTDSPSTKSHEEWLKKFDALMARQVSRNPNFDDSRESIYPIR